MLGNSVSLTGVWEKKARLGFHVLILTVNYKGVKCFLSLYGVFLYNVLCVSFKFFFVSIIEFFLCVSKEVFQHLVYTIPFDVIIITFRKNGVILERFCCLSPVRFPYMSVYSISMYVCSQLASIGVRARQLETDVPMKRNIDCVQDFIVRILFATFVPNILIQEVLGSSLVGTNSLFFFFLWMFLIMFL